MPTADSQLLESQIVLLTSWSFFAGDRLTVLLGVPVQQFRLLGGGEVVEPRLGGDAFQDESEAQG